nr:HlyD family efflux transporter periplasmic adaptor subunit [Halorhodospira abdelmalekii]
MVIALRPNPLLIDAEGVSRGPLERTVTEEGETRVIERYRITAPVTAHAARITLEPGDSVTAGEVLLRLAPVTAPMLDARTYLQAQARWAAAVAALESAREEAAAARAAAESAADAYARSQALSTEAWVTERALEEAAAERRRTAAAYRATQARVALAQAQRDEAAAALAPVRLSEPPSGGGASSSQPLSSEWLSGESFSLELRAPIDGVVLHRSFESAQVVQPGESILEIADLSRLEVVVEVRSEDAVGITPGMAVRLERWGGEGPLAGRVRRVEPAGFEYVTALGVEEQRVRIIVDLETPRTEWERLGDGYRVQAVFILWAEDDVLRVPSSALFRKGEQWGVFVIEEGRARLRSVEIGQRGARLAAVVSGLEAGEQVVVHPPRELSDGDRVALR